MIPLFYTSVPDFKTGIGPFTCMHRRLRNNRCFWFHLSVQHLPNLEALISSCLCFLCFSRPSVGKPQEQRNATGWDEDPGVHISVSI